MKVLIILALVACASAKLFKISNGTNTCAMLSLEGTLEAQAFDGETQVGTKSLNFDGASASGTCDTAIVLNMTSGAKVRFQRSVNGTALTVTPIVSFFPNLLFGEKVNETDEPVFNGNTVGFFQANESFTCMAAEDRPMTLNGGPKKYNFTVSIKTSNLQVQFGNIENDTFSAGPVCDDDKPTTPQSTTEGSSTTPSSSSSSPATPTTPAPTAPKVDFNVTSDNITCILMEGTFTVEVTYAVGKENQTYRAVVPKSATSNGNCQETNKTSVLNIHFDAGVKTEWLLQFTFMQDDDTHYHVSEIALTYDDLPNSDIDAAQTAKVNPGNDYLKASTNGYYTCSASQDETLQNVKLTTTDFKYRAFNKDPKVSDFSGDVAECSADDDTNSVVPIAVGAALAGLVVIVLIAYLIGRRRSRKSGYESV